jgi:hypothetical protein
LKSWIITDKGIVESISYDITFSQIVDTTVPERAGTDKAHRPADFSLSGKIVSFLIIGLFPLL